MLGLALLAVALALTHGRSTGPANGVYAGGEPRPVVREQLVGATAVTPGAIIIRGATDGLVIEAGAASVLVVGVAAENEKYDAANYLVDHAIGDPCPYYDMAGTLFYGMILANSAALVYGDDLMAAAGGTLEKASSRAVACAKFSDPVSLTPGGTMVRKLCTFTGGA